MVNLKLVGLLFLLTVAGCEQFPSAPVQPKCLRIAFVLTDSKGKTIGDTTWTYESPVVGTPCTIK